MAREDAGNYGGKHPEETEINAEIADLVYKRGEDNSIACGTAHKIAEELDVTPLEVGETIDLMEYKIAKCQMGLFGYGKGKKLIKPVTDISDELKTAITKRAPQGYLSCLDIWNAAEEAGVTRLEAACGVEGLELRIQHCQLGAFKK